jgi:hypothetical protein
MQRRVLSVFVILLMGLLWAFPTTQAQALYVTNLDQLVAEAYSTDHSIYLPFSPWDWRAFSIDGGEPWWLDCSQVSCDGLFQNPTELAAGVPAYKVVLIQNVLTGETTIQPDGSSNVVATIAAPSGYQPVTNSWNRWMWNWYQQVIDQPDVWGLSPSEVPPPTTTLKALLADVSNFATYAAFQSNLEAQAEAECAAQATVASMNSRFMPMDDPGGGGGDPCTLTNLLQPFAATTIARGTNGATTITWQSCQFLRYLVFSASAMSNNMQWVPQAYVWGSNGASATTWTDTATTNDDGSTITQRFYRVQRILGSPIAAGASHGLVAISDGSLWGWGYNVNGQVGDGTYTERDSAVLVAPYPCGGGESPSDTVAVAAGYNFSVAVDVTGHVWTWGDNLPYGQLGNGGDNNGELAPSLITGVSNVVSVAAGYQHALALRSDKKVFAWGDNSDYQLGIGSTPSSNNYPIQSIGLTQIVAIAAGDYHSVALDSGGNVWTWGYGVDGEIGDGGVTNVSTPTMLTNISTHISRIRFTIRG